LYLGRNLETEFIDGDYSDGYPFSENSALKSLTVGNNVTAINDYSFQNCTGLTQITSNATEPPALQTNTFNGVNRSINVIVPCGYLNDYRKNQDWNTFINMNDGGCTGIEDVSANQLSIYPNPVKDEIFIKSDLQIAKVEIYSSTGALLLSDNNFNEKISVSKLLKGVYLIKVYTSNGIIVSKIVKE